MKYWHIPFIFVLLLMSSCSEDIGDNSSPENGGAVEIKSVSARIGEASTRASVGGIYIGRDAFVARDRMTLTDIRRTSQPIPAFNYSDMAFDCGEEGGWKRDLNTGSTEEKPDLHPERIYWSDAHSEHTFIGYSVPQQLAEDAFDWMSRATDDGKTVFYGSLGDPTVTTMTQDDKEVAAFIDYTAGNDALKGEDILFAYHDDMVSASGGSEALVTFQHGLANVKVVVNISGYTGSQADIQTRVSDLRLCGMHTMYKWTKYNGSAASLTENDQTVLDGLYGENNVSYDQKKDIRLWLPDSEGTDVGSNRRFTFHGIVVPETIGDSPEDRLTVSFKAKYPNPIRPSVDVTNTYTAVMPVPVTFHAGKTTTININLNHKDELITIGAEYNDWEFTDTPDQGSLKKKSTFLSYNSKEEAKITTHNDAKATIDDATWLYKKTDGSVVDIYGHSGNSFDDPYTITCAEELLSFAYEVKEGFSETVMNGSGDAVTSAKDFQGKYVKLDADIVMQRSVTATDISWVGIGDAAHPFDGRFDGGMRAISFLQGSPFFAALGQNSHVTQIRIVSTAGEGVTGTGGITGSNAGNICASSFSGTVTHTGSADFVGGIAGSNTGSIVACSHVGDIVTDGNAAGISGQNSGYIVASYSAGRLTIGDGCSSSGVAMQVGDAAKVESCYYDSTLLIPTDKSDNAKGLTTNYMQRYVFVGPKPSEVSSMDDYKDHPDAMNRALYNWMMNQTFNEGNSHILDNFFSYQPGAYPKVE